MPNEFIDLGCGLDSPAYPATAKDAPKKSYPCFTFTCDEEIDLPDGEFTFTAKGRKVSHNEDTRDPEEPRHRYEIEVQGFKPQGGAKKSEGMTSMADAFKRGMDRKMASKMGMENDSED
jgi:hypothetical protein